jgi:serine protease Do
MEGREFDAQVVLSPKNSPRGKLLSQYVNVRVTRMDDVDIALFERDWNNTLYFFMLDADERIYMRWGGRDARGPYAYLDLNSLENALAQGLELHRLNKAGGLPAFERPKPRFPKEIPPLVERTFARRQCVECHLIGDFDLIHREQTGTLDKMQNMYRWPDIRNLGIELDVPKGLVVKEAKGSVQTAGMQPGDRIVSLDGTPVYTFADLQYRLDKVPRTAKQLTLEVARGDMRPSLKVALPERWWVTDLRFRQLSVDPRAEFESRPLTADEKRKLNLKPEGFAAEVTRIGGFAEMLKIHELKAGDIVTAVDGVDRDDVAHTPDLFIKLRRNAGDTVMLDIIRAGKPMKMEVKTQRMYFRK